MAISQAASRTKPEIVNNERKRGAGWRHLRRWQQTNLNICGNTCFSPRLSHSFVQMPLSQPIRPAPDSPSPDSPSPGRHQTNVKLSSGTARRESRTGMGIR